MALQFAVSTRNAILQAIVDDLGASPTCKIFTGAKPSSTSDGDSGTQLAELDLPASAFGAPSGGQIAKSGTWQDSSADADGVAGHFRLYTSGGDCKAQGTVSEGGGGGDLIVDNSDFNTGQQFTINTFTLTAPGA